jgi:hypothetical protein
VTDVDQNPIEALERRVFFEELNRRFADLRQDEPAWIAIMAERHAWERTLRDSSR